ncbi:MAG TPA: amidohydrolase family protein [Vicinamibacteria bacterium]|nr:amidohydrolase family protein [Vicinamibacteria bacterium]
MAVRVLRASWVVPVCGPPLADGLVAVADGRIAWLGGRYSPGRPDGPLTDLGNGILAPGLVNAHCHLELSHLAGRLPRAGGFVPWVEALVAARLYDEPGVVRERAREAIGAAQEAGTVAVGDVSNTLVPLDLLRDSRLRAVVFYELLGWDPGRCAAVLQAAEERLAGVVGGLDGRVRVRLAAHAPHSVSPPLLMALRRRGGPASIHLAESEAETDFLGTGGGEWAGFLARRGLAGVPYRPAGLTPVRYLESLGVLHPGLVAAHCVHVDGEDRAILARRGVHVALCPRSNRNLGVGLPPLPDLLADGVRLCLGTDSVASGDSLDLLQDAALLHRAYPRVEPALLVRLATAGGAEALGLPDLGTLAPGQAAEMAFAPAAAGLADPCAFLVSGEARLQRLAA